MSSSSLSQPSTLFSKQQAENRQNTYHPLFFSSASHSFSMPPPPSNVAPGEKVSVYSGEIHVPKTLTLAPAPPKEEEKEDVLMMEE